MDYRRLAGTHPALVGWCVVGSGHRLRLRMAGEPRGRFHVRLDRAHHPLVASWGMGFACNGLGRRNGPVSSAVALLESGSRASHGGGLVSPGQSRILKWQLD